MVGEALYPSTDKSEHSNSAIDCRTERGRCLHPLTFIAVDRSFCGLQIFCVENAKEGRFEVLKVDRDYKKRRETKSMRVQSFGGLYDDVCWERVERGPNGFMVDVNGKKRGKGNDTC